MSTRTVLKTFFEAGDKPTQAQFEDLINSVAHLSDDFVTLAEAEAGASTSPKIWSPQRVKQLVDANPSGDVIGPSSAIDDNIVVFDSTSGKLIKDSGFSLADIRGALGTSVSYGLEASINGGDNTKFDVAAGLALVVNNYTDPENPAVTIVLKSAITSAETVTNLATQDLTFVGLNAAGTFVQQATFFTQEQKRDITPITALVHVSRTQIDFIGGLQLWNKDLALGLDDLSCALGRTINQSGNVYSPNGANLFIDRSAGVSYINSGNYENNKQNPNYLTTILGTAITFSLVTSQAGSGSFTQSIPNTQFDPNRDGILQDITDNYYVVHRVFYEPTTNATVVQYAQEEYDSLKKAIDRSEWEAFIPAPELTGVALRGAIVIQKGTTDLTDDDKVKFINPAPLGSLVLHQVPSYSRFAENMEIIDGMSYQRPSITYVNDGGTLYADVEAVGGGDIVYVFTQKEFILDCTTGSGVGGRARIALTAGTATVPVENFVSVIRSGSTSILQAGITEPTGQFGWVGQVLMPDATTFDTTGPYSTQRNSDNKAHDGRGALSYEREKIRDLGVTYKSGILPTITITDLATDTLDVSFTGGVVKQLHKKDLPPLASNTDGIYIINHPTTPYLRVTDLETITIDAQGNTLENRSYNFVFIGIASSADGVEYSKIGVLLPNASYAFTATQTALQDPSNTAVTSVPTTLARTAFLIARVTFKLKTGSLTNVVEDELSPQTFFDLRGTVLGANAGGSGAPAVSSFLDNVFNIISNVSGFTLQWVLDNLTANRTVTWPDISGLAAVFGMTNAFSFGGQVKSDENIQPWSAATNYDLNNGNFQSSVVSATSTVSLTNKSLGSAYTIDLLVNGTGGYTLTFDSTFGDIDGNGESSPLSVLASERYIVSVLHSTNGTITIITKKV